MRPIAINLSPNTEGDDVFLALRTLLSADRWQDEQTVQKLEKEFAQKFGKGYKAFSFNSGRSAEYAVLKALGIGRGDEVAIQAFTCVAVPNSILWLGAKPLYVDIDEDYNMSPEDLKKKITPKTKAIIVQHTFGIPAKIDEIKKIAEEGGIYLIEDCAHALGATYNGAQVGTFGDAAFFSFGRDKVLSSVFGGMAIAKNTKIKNQISKFRNGMALPTNSWVAQQLFHPVAMSFVLPVYTSGMGKLLLVALQKLGLLSRAVYKEEKSCRQPGVFPTKMPGGLAVLARHQIEKLEKYNRHRRKIAGLYFNRLKNTPGLILPPNDRGAVWLRFPIRHKRAEGLYGFAKKRGILLGDWYKDVVTPVKHPSLAGYKNGSCPRAEEYTKTIVNLPTYPTLTEEQAETIVHLIKQWITQ